MARPALPYDNYLDDLERDLLGLRHRLLELQGMASVHPDQIKAQKDAIKAAEENLRQWGQKPESKRPRKAAESR